MHGRPWSVGSSDDYGSFHRYIPVRIVGGMNKMEDFSIGKKLKSH